MTLIAIEEHWNQPAVLAALKALPGDQRDPSLALSEMGDTLARLDDLGEGRIAAMDAQGIDMQVISLAPPGTGAVSPADAVALSRDANDRAAEAARRYPSRLRALATLPMASPGAVAGELERAAGLGLVGTMVYGRTGETQLDDPCYDDLFATAERLALPVFIHPQVPPRAVRDALYSGFSDMTDLAFATFGWGWHLDAAIAALRLIVRGTLDRHPALQVILGHWGELLPFWSDRTDILTRITGLQRQASDYIRDNFHLTCSGILNPVLLRHALEVTTPGRLIFSTDYPFQNPAAADITRFLAEFKDNGDREKFSSANARALFRISD